jgi:hypothetical protein
LNPELAHARAQGGRNHIQNKGGAFGTVDASVGELKHPQQLGLQLRPQFADLIQKNTGAVGNFKPTRLPGLGPRKSAALVAEQLAFESEIESRVVSAPDGNHGNVGPRYHDPPAR